MYDSCGDPYYVGPPRHELSVPPSIRLGIRDAADPAAEEEGEIGVAYADLDSAPVIPTRTERIEEEARLEVHQYDNDERGAEEASTKDASTGD